MPVKLLTLSNGVLDNANTRSTKEHRDKLEAFMRSVEGDASGIVAAGKRSWTLKGKKAKPEQAEFDVPGMEHETNDACEEIAQELATALIEKEAAQATVSEKRAELKDAMKAEGLDKYISFSRDDGGKRTWRITSTERLTLTRPKDEDNE